MSVGRTGTRLMVSPPTPASASRIAATFAVEGGRSVYRGDLAIPGVAGTVTLDAHRNPTKSAVVLTVRRGRFTLRPSSVRFSSIWRWINRASRSRKLSR